MHEHGPKNVGRAIEMDPTLLHYTSAITEQKKMLGVVGSNFDWFQTLHNNSINM